MCISKPRIPKPPPPPASTPAAAVLNTKTVDFDAVDSDSAALKKKSKGKKQFRIAKNDMGTPMSGSGLSIPRST